LPVARPAILSLACRQDLPELYGKAFHPRRTPPRRSSLKPRNYTNPEAMPKLARQLLNVNRHVFCMAVTVGDDLLRFGRKKK
jgi:hypothetical protein